jgi:signal transduction histidine kinase
MTSRRLALAVLWTAVVGAELGALALMASYGAPDNLALDLLVAVTTITAGVVALDKRPGNRIGWLMVAMAVAWIVPPYTAFGVPALTSVVLAVNSLYFAFAAHLVLAYPGGRLQTGLERVLVALIYLAYAWIQLAWLALPSGSAVVEALPVIGLVQRMVLAPLFVVAVLLRFVRSSRIERRELMPLWTGAVLLAVIELLDVGSEASASSLQRMIYDLRSLLLVLLPLVFLYGLLTSRTAQSAVGALVLRLRDGVPPGQLAPLLAESIGDPSLRVLYATDRAGGWVSADQEQVADLARFEDRKHAVTVIERDGHPYAAMVHDRAVSDTLVRGVASAAAISMENDRLHAELRAQLAEVRASRLRIVAAGDRERRRVERDLHDGAQQRLLALSMALRSARRQLEASGPGGTHVLDAAEAELKLAIQELRELARGIHPTVLTDDGLEAAVRSLAARATVPVRVGFDVVGHPSKQTEATAYFAISECLANVAKHSGATSADVVARSQGDVLVVEVRDDGCGGASLEGGSGLSGLVDRVAASGGRLELRSPCSQGTCVRIELPLDIGQLP